MKFWTARTRWGRVRAAARRSHLPPPNGIHIDTRAADARDANASTLVGMAGYRRTYVAASSDSTAAGSSSSATTSTNRPNPSRCYLTAPRSPS
jgi:hypothetical protein